MLKGHIAVSDFRLKNTSGSEIDIKARKYLKQIGLNYSHGTGHGVGYFLNVHEGPQAISNKNKVSFEEGMIVSNEPGYYEKGKFGIRIENLLYVKKQNNKKYFEDFTLAPIEKDLIDKSMLDKNEERWLNNYHKKVFNNLKSFMNKQEIKDLKRLVQLSKILFHSFSVIILIFKALASSTFFCRLRVANNQNV